MQFALMLIPLFAVMKPSTSWPGLREKKKKLLNCKYLFPVCLTSIDYEIDDFRTRSAMRGGLNFRDALAKRLDLIKPSQQLISDYLKLHPPRFTAGIKYVHFLNSFLTLSLILSHSQFLTRQN